MGVLTYTSVDIANLAQGALGDERVTSIDTPTNKVDRWYALHYPLVVNATLEAHPWNFATFRHTLLAYTIPDATITPAAATGENILVTASDDIFASTDVGRHLIPDEGGGKATIVTFIAADQVAVDFEEDFSGTDAIEAEDWKFYYAFPEWGHDYRIAVPTDTLRVWRTKWSEPYQVQGDGYIIADVTSLDVQLIRQVLNPAQWTTMFTQCVVAHLTAERAEVTTGQMEKAQLFRQKYEFLLRRARTRDGQEGTPETLVAGVLLDARSGVRTWNTRTPG